VDTDAGHRVLDTDTGYWTPDIGDRTHGHRTRGRWTDTGRRTLDGRTPDTPTLTQDTPTLTQDADRATKAQWASGHPGTTTPLGRRTVLLGRHTRRSATMTARRCGHLPARETAGCPARQLLGRSAGGQAAPRRTALVCVLDLDGTRGGQWDYGKVRGCGVGLVRRC
jgi:hypothetical protein